MKHYPGGTQAGRIGWGVVREPLDAGRVRVLFSPSPSKYTYENIESLNPHPKSPKSSKPSRYFFAGFGLSVFSLLYTLASLLVAVFITARTNLPRWTYVGSPITYKQVYITYSGLQNIFRT